MKLLKVARQLQLDDKIIHDRLPMGARVNIYRKRTEQ